MIYRPFRYHVILALMICLLPLTAGGDPVVVGQYKTPGVVKGVFVSGAYPYVVDGPSGLEVFDISGNKPIRLGSCNTSESIGYGGLLALKDDPTAISGRAWNDLSYNGTREVDGFGRQNVQVELLDGNGNYQISHLNASTGPNGTYRFNVIPEGPTQGQVHLPFR